ncbi:MAG: Ku protein [Bacteroidota bacterium]|jgi:DNA end-binding protein Ku
MARAYWKGHLRLSLVSIAVEIYNAIDTSTDITFRQIHKPSGKRINYTKTVKGVGEVQNADIVKGFEIDDNTYVVLEPEEIDAIKLESKKTIELAQFVDVSEIDSRYFERPYFVLPADDLSAEGYVVIRTALERAGKVGLGQVTIAGREYLVAIGPLGKGLVMNMLRYGNELRDKDEYFDKVPDLKPEKELVDLATQLIKSKSAAFDPGRYKNHYEVALRALIEKKRRGQKIIATTDEPVRASAKVIDLMDALRKSVGDDRKSAGADGKKPKAGGRKRA